MAIFFQLNKSLAGILQQESDKVEMADLFRSEGKIYVVVLVVIILITGLIVYTILTDRKVLKLQRDLDALKSRQKNDGSNA
ncbi:MAG: hypothetical protein JJU28_06930 [Cyclobacteriaceae bacterium]|nr:hypothetical protein [Cyclobacteriaceae bacterium]